jgi:hypothetical protein
VSNSTFLDLYIKLTQSSVYCSINHFFFIRGQRCPPAYLPRKLNAIQNINKELQRVPSDHAMVAVAVMTLLEVSHYNLFLPGLGQRLTRDSVWVANRQNGSSTEEASS